MAITKSKSFKGGAIAGEPTPIPVPADALFIVRFNETPASDIGDALQEKKVPCLFYNGEVVELFHASANKYVFRTTHIRSVDGENILDIVDYIVIGLNWSTSTKEISNGYESQAYLRDVSSPTTFDTTGQSGMKTVASVSDVPNDGIYQVSVMLSVTPKTASPTKSDLVFGFYGPDGLGMPDHIFHAVVDDSQTFAQQLSFSTTLNLKAGTNSLKMACDGLNTEYLVFVDNLTVAQLVNGVYHNGDTFEEVNDLTEAIDFNADDELLVVSPNSKRKMLWTTLANKVLGFIKSLSTTITAFRTGDVIAVDGPSGTAKMSKDDLLRSISQYPSLVHTEIKDKVFSVTSGSAVVVAYIQLHELHKYRMVVERISGSGSFSYGIKEGNVTDIYKLEGGVVTQNPATASDVATLWIYTTANAVFKVSACDVEESQAVFDERTLCRIAIDQSYYKTEEASATVHFYPLDIKSNVTYIVEVSGVKSGDQLSVSGGTSGSAQNVFISNYSLDDGLNRLKFTSDENYDGLRFWLPNGGTIRVSPLETPSCSYTTTAEGTGLVISSDALNTLFGGLVLITMPNTLYSEVKFVGEASTRRLSSGFSFHGREKIEKLKLLRVDGTPLSSLSATEENEFKIYRISSKNPNYDVTIADGSLSEANECDAADFVVNRYNAQLIIQAAIACKSCTKILLYRGDYIMTSLHECYCSKTGTTSRAILSTFDGYIYNGDKVYREQKTIELVGNTAHLPENHDEPRTAYMPRIRVGYAVVSSISLDNCSGILIPKPDDNDLDGEGGASMLGASNTGTSLLMRNVVMQDDYMNGNKNFAFTDLTYADSVTLENCRVFSTNRLGSITTNDGLPLEGFVGFRFGRGSNKGIGCSVKHCYVEGVFYGYDCSGEHYLFEDCQVRHCVCALRLGGMLTRWSQIHPVTLVGCSFEACQRLIELDRYGKGATYTSPVRALQVVNLSSEDSLSVSGFLPSPKIGIVPKSKGAWSGKIDLCFRDKASDYETQGVAINPVTGEGAENIIVDNLVCKVCGETSERPAYFPYDGFRFFDKTLGKPIFAKVGTCAKIKIVVNSSSATAGTAGFSIGGFYSPVKFGTNKGTQADVVTTFEKWLKFACYQDVKVENGNEITFTNPRPRSISAVLFDAGATGVSITSSIVSDGSSGAWVDAEGIAV